VVCRLSQDGITPISILYNTNAFFVPLLQEYRQELNNGVADDGQVYTGNPCIYGVFDAYTNKYIIAMEEINRYYDCNFNGGTAISYAFITTTTTTTTLPPTTTTTTIPTFYAGYSYRVSEAGCVPAGSTGDLYLNSTDNDVFISNGGCFLAGFTIRESNGAPISGTFYFFWDGIACVNTIFKSTNGYLTYHTC